MLLIMLENEYFKIFLFFLKHLLFAAKNANTKLKCTKNEEDTFTNQKGEEKITRYEDDIIAA